MTISDEMTERKPKLKMKKKRNQSAHTRNLFKCFGPAIYFNQFFSKFGISSNFMVKW